MSVLSYFQRGVLTITETPGGQLARPEDNPSDNTHSLYSSSRTVRGQRTENLPKQYCVQQWINISSKNGTVGNGHGSKGPSWGEYKQNKKGEKFGGEKNTQWTDNR